MPIQDDQNSLHSTEDQPVIDIESNSVDHGSMTEKNELLDAARKIVEKREHVSQSSSRKGKNSKKSGKQEAFDWNANGALIIGSGLFIAILLYAIFGVCNHRKVREPRTISEESVLPTIVRYGGDDLPGKTFVGLEATRTDRNPELIEEVKSVINAGGAPGEIFKNDVPPDSNVAVELRRQFENYRQNPGELEALRRESPYSDGKINPEAVSKVSDVLERLEPKRLQIRQMLNREGACFSFEFVTLPPDPNQPDLGEIPDTQGSDFLTDYAMLEEFAIARALLENNIAKATESLAYIFGLAQLASEVKNPGIRVQAGQVRLRAIDVLQAIVMHPGLKEIDLAYLFAMLHEQLDLWTPDAHAWIGDRASGMKVYNLIIQYGLDTALEPDEIKELHLRNLYEPLSRNLKDRVAADQIFYLRAMQEIIATCQHPFYKRLGTLNRIDERIRLSQGTPEESVIAEFLLRGIRDRMLFCAQDRTKCEMATLAIAASLKDTRIRFGPSAARKTTDENGKSISQIIDPRKTMRELTITPLSGNNYEIRQIQNDREPLVDVVWVSYRGNMKPFRVPDFSKR